MSETLASMFAAARSPEIDWEGAPAYGIYEISPVPKTVVVEFLRSADVPVQGLSFKARGAVLVVNDVEAPEMLFWRDTAPDKVRIQIKLTAKAATLKLWNVWRGKVGGHDVTQAWLGNSGMRIEKSADGAELLLRCSDGEGPIAFEDLEARVTLTDGQV